MAVPSAVGDGVMPLFPCTLYPFGVKRCCLGLGCRGHTLAQAQVTFVTLDESLGPSVPLTERGQERILKFLMAPTGYDFEGKLYKTLL